MIFIGIDAAKDKHDCFIISSDGEVLLEIFTISKALMTYLVKSNLLLLNLIKHLMHILTACDSFTSEYLIY